MKFETKPVLLILINMQTRLPQDISKRSHMENHRFTTLKTRVAKSLLTNK